VGFLKQDGPQVDFASWVTGTRSEKIRPMARHWAEVGFGTPVVLHLFYVVKIVLYVLVAWLIALSTSGIDGFTHVKDWYDAPVVYEKVVLFTMLFEVLGLGCGFGPLNNRFFPPMGSPLYWLRPNTIRLPPWPSRIPFTKGDTRTPFDCALYAALLLALVVALFSNPTDLGVLPMWETWTILGILTVVSLRDKVIFLAARGEVYAWLTVAFLFAEQSGADMILGLKLVCLTIWMGAATSKLNKHFPFVISTMMSNNPVLRPKWIKRRFFEDFPDDLRPGRPSRVLAHTSTAVEGLVPLVLLFGHGTLLHVAAVVMLLFHFGILSAIPMGVPLEWNVFMMFSVLALFVGHPEIGVTDMTTPLPVLLWLTLAVCVVLGNVAPRKVSFLPGMRYYAGNWDVGLWCVKPSASAKIEANVVSIASMPQSQMERFYGSPENAMMYLYMGYAFRGFNSHGRAMFSLAHRAMADGNEDDYLLLDGERICSTALGWNFGDGHMHNEQLIAALHKRCQFEPGEVRVVLIDAQPIHRQRQEYRIVDAATGEFERGHVEVADMVTRQPWDDTTPVHVH
jgi:hypothetical protein